MKIQFNYSDESYRDAVNWEHDFYSDPVTVEIDNTKYILPVGSSDHLEYLKTNEFVYVVGENIGLGYISCTIVDPAEKEIMQNVFIDDIDANEYFNDIFDLEISDQIDKLSECFE